MIGNKITINNNIINNKHIKIYQLRDKVNNKIREDNFKLLQEEEYK